MARAARTVAGGLAVLAWATLALQLYLSLSRNAANGNGVLVGVLIYYSYFTVLTNTIAAIVLTAAAVGHRAASGAWWTRPTVRGATTAYMTMVGIIYTLVLRATWDPRGWQKLADVVLHDVMPLAFAIYWLLFWRTGTLRPANIRSWLVYPLVYLGYCLIHGAITGWYPYAFLDVPTLGLPHVLAIAAAITIAFSLLSLGVVGIDRLTRVAQTRRAPL